jgi:hypothetical protein
MKNGSVEALLQSQKLVKKSYTQELREREEVKNKEDLDVSSCICGNCPTRNTFGVQDMGATLPCPYYECKGCGIDSRNSGVWAYPGEWKKAAKGWEVFICNLKDRYAKDKK